MEESAGREGVNLGRGHSPERERQEASVAI